MYPVGNGRLAIIALAKKQDTLGKRVVKSYIIPFNLRWHTNKHYTLSVILLRQLTKYVYAAIENGNDQTELRWTFSVVKCSLSLC